MWQLQLLYFCTFASFCSLSPYLPIVLQERLGLTRATIGNVSALTPLLSACTVPLWSLAADKWTGPKRLLEVTLISSLSIFIWFYFMTFGDDEKPTQEKLPIAYLFALLNAFFISPVGAMLDTWTLRLLADRHLYGKYRLWGALSAGLSTLLTGLCVDIAGTYRIAFALFAFWTVMTIIVIQIVPKKESNRNLVHNDVDLTPEMSSTSLCQDVEKAPSSSIGDIKATVVIEDMTQVSNVVNSSTSKWSQLTPLAVFYFSVLTVGIVQCMMGLFLFIYLTDSLNATPLVLGWTGPCSVLIELPFFFYAPQVLKRVGKLPMLCVAMILAGARAAAYGWWINGFSAWWSLPVELIQGATFVLLWTAAVAFVDDRVDDRWRATAQGILSSVYGNLGGGVGALLGGYLYDAHSPRLLWIVAAFMAWSAASLFIIHVVVKKKKSSSLLPENEKNQLLKT